MKSFTRSQDRIDDWVFEPTMPTLVRDLDPAWKTYLLTRVSSARSNEIRTNRLIIDDYTQFYSTKYEKELRAKGRTNLRGNRR